MQCLLPFTLRRTLSAAGLLFCVNTSFAAADAANQATDLDNVVVTASRTTQTQNAALAAVSVITRDEIERRAPASLPELLRGVPGMSIAANGGPGKAASMFLRGSDSDHVLVLVDGIRVGSAFNGAAAIQDIPVEQIERIEVVRGPFSSLYGSDAIGGVIQIFTRRPQDSFTPSFSIGAGNLGTQRIGAGIAGRGEGNGGWYSLQAAYESTEGVDAYRDNPDSPWDDFGLDDDRDGYRNASLSLSGGRQLGGAWSVEAHALHAQGNNRYDGSYANESDVVQQVLGARLRFTPSTRTTFTANLGRSDDLSDDFYGEVPVGNFDSHRSSGSLQGDFRTGRGLATLGYDWRRDEVASSVAFDETRRINRGVFAQWQQEFDAHSLQLSVRHDKDSQFGGKSTGSALWGRDLTQTLRLTASYGTAYKAPTFNELYYPGYGNPNLAPETSRSFELGMRGQQRWGEWTLNAFNTRIDDLIAYDPALTDELHPFGQPNNVERALIRGLEVAGETRLAGWNLRGTATWTDPVNDSNDYQGKLLARRARASGRVDVDRSWGAFQAGASVNGSGHRYDDPANTVRVGGYATTDLRLAYTIAASLTLQFNVNNILDKRYETIAFYNQPQRNYLLTLRYRPGR